MNLIDILFILIIILFGVIGLKRGFFKSVVSALGLILVFVISFYLKNPIAEWLSLNLPFFNFGGDFKDVTILNVIIYQLIAFVIVFVIVFAIYSIILKITKVFEKLLRLTIILGIPSKILGFIFGIIEGCFISAIALMILSLPVFGFDLVHESKVKNFLFENTPFISGMMDNTSHAVDDIMNLRDKFTSNSKKGEFNKEAFNILLKYDVITTSYADKLLDSGKLKIEGGKDIVNLYK